MYKMFYALLNIIWICDILNIIPYLDTTLPINGLAWFLIIMCIPSPSNNKER